MKLSPEQLKAVATHKYIGGEYSWLDNKMNPFWEFVATLFPDYVSPNLISISSFLFICSANLLILCYDTTLQKDIPNWVFLYTAFSMFMWQTLDAVDGKHARRTKTSSPLGQVIDHGLDVVSNLLCVMPFAQACKMNQEIMLIMFMVMQITYFVGEWCEYVTEIRLTQIGNCGITEGQVVAIMFHLLTGIFGQHIWQYNLIQVFGMDKTAMNDWLAMLLSINIGIIYTFVIFLMTSFIAISFIRLSYTNNSKGIINTSKPLIPMIACFTLQILWYYSGEFTEHFSVYLMAFGTLTSLHNWKIILCSMGKVRIYIIQMKFSIFHYEIVPFVAMTFAIFFLESHTHQILILYLAFFTALGLAAEFTTSVLVDLKNFLGVHVFWNKPNTTEKNK